MHDPADTQHLLDQVAFLAHVPGAAGRRLASTARPVRFAAGSALFQRGDPGEGMLIVLDGLVRLHLSTAASRELTLGLAGRGEPVGEVALVDGGPRSADATALTPVAVLLFRHAAAPLITGDAALASALPRTLAARLRRTTDQAEAVGLQGLPQRLASALLHLAAVDPAGLVRLPQGRIAALIAATRPTVNAALAWSRARPGRPSAGRAAPGRPGRAARPRRRWMRAGAG